ncbi:MAG TPA: TIGR03084 family metal-binding protein [Acidimicrobiales bacterium]|nr:TIGR03084 family metal-binding protein [Acidimicrobiales bacterium]
MSRRPGMAELARDLAAEHHDVAALVAGLDPGAWDTPTPAEGWTVRDQITHLAWFDAATVTAVTDGAAFAVIRADADADVDGFVERVRKDESGRQGSEAAHWWAAERARLVAAVRDLAPDRRVPWFGPEMSLASKVTARIMETWAHGQDVADALGRARPGTDRLRHVAHIGVRARPYSYAVRDRDLPAAEMRVELTAPSGAEWAWGPEDGPDRVTGAALDFCLVVTQRRHLDDTALDVTPGPAREWMEIAQAFAGPAGPGRRPGQFRRGAGG